MDGLIDLSHFFFLGLQSGLLFLSLFNLLGLISFLPSPEFFFCLFLLSFFFLLSLLLKLELFFCDLCFFSPFLVLLNLQLSIDLLGKVCYSLLSLCILLLKRALVLNMNFRRLLLFFLRYDMLLREEDLTFRQERMILQK